MDDKVNPYIKALSSGLAVVCEAATGGLFMENLKMEKQRTSQPYPVIVKRVLGQGIKGFEAGLIPWGITVGMSKGTALGLSHAMIKNKCNEYELSKTMTTNVAGFGSGAFQGACISPLMLARSRVNEVISSRPKAGTWREEIRMSGTILNNAIKKDGVGSLFNGMGATIAKRSFDWGLRFNIKSIIDAQLQKHDIKNTTFVGIGSAFASGTLSAFITMPIDRTIPLLQSSAGGNFFTALKQKIAKEGYGTLFRGYGIRAINTGYHTTFAIFVADIIYKNTMKLDSKKNEL